MSTKKLFNFLIVAVLGFVLSGCANSQFAKKYNKPFKHNTPLIKKDMKALINFAEKVGINPTLLNAVEQTNKKQTQKQCKNTQNR